MDDMNTFCNFRMAHVINTGTKDVETFGDHEANQEYQQQGWPQDRGDQRHAFPHDMHEDGDDEAGLEQHENDDQGPAQHALEIEKIHQVGKKKLSTNSRIQTLR